MLPSTPRSSKWFPYIRFLQPEPVKSSLLSHTVKFVLMYVSYMLLDSASDLLPCFLAKFT
jgi:hypothetical protein